MKRAITYDDISIIPTYSKIESRSLCNIETNIGKILLSTPLIASPMDTICDVEMCFEMSILGGIGILHRFMSIEEQVNSCLDLDYNDVLYGAAVGVNGDSRLRISRLLAETDVSFLCIDVAHGHHILVKDTISYIKEKDSSIHVMAGNICTEEAALVLKSWGADSLRVGIGNGSMCETRIRAGVGVPQVSAIIECLKSDLPIIADGGCKTTGDIAKSLALGANAVMIGSLFSGTKETPGIISKMGMWPNEKLYKKYQGSASIDSKLSRGKQSKNVEGNSKITPYKGKVRRIVNDINDGIRSSMSYVGAKNLEEFRNKAVFIEVTNAGQIEAQPHGVI